MKDKIILNITQEQISFIIGKLLSGRFILTLVGGAAFIIAISLNEFPHEATAAILTAIFMSYFNRIRGGQNNGK